MSDIFIIFEYLSEYIPIGLKSNTCTLIISTFLSLVIVYYDQLKLYLENETVHKIDKVIENDLYKLCFLGLILGMYSINKIISILLLILFLINNKFINNTDTVDEKYDNIHKIN